MNKLLVAIFEDNEATQRDLVEVVGESGNEVVIAAGHVDEAARLIIERINKLGSLCVHLAFVDKNLYGGEGDKIVEMLLAAGMPLSSIVNISNDSNISVENGSIVLPFVGKDRVNIAEIIAAFSIKNDTPACSVPLTGSEVN
jgi:hypothetical protein